MTFDLSWARGPVESWDGRFFEAVDLQGKVGNQLFQLVLLPLEVFDLLTGGLSYRIPGETLFPRFHELFGPGIEDPGLIPSLRQRSLTVTSLRNPSRTMRILSSGVYFLRVLVRTCRMKVSVSWVEISATGLDRCCLGTLPAPF